MTSLMGLIPDNILILNNNRFKLTGVAGEGGSSIVYLAVPVDSLQSSYVMIKELCPRGCNIKRITTGSNAGMIEIDSGSSGSIDKFRKIKNRVMQEAEITGTLRNDRVDIRAGVDENLTKSNNPWLLDYSVPVEANGTLYTIIDTKSGETLKSLIDRKFFEEKDFPYICDLMIKILDSLEYIHSKGYLHLDIAPDNIFIPEYKTGFSEIVHVHTLDFNSALEKGTGPEGWISSYKEGYTAPELDDIHIKPVDLDETADLYSVTAVFFELLTGRKLKRSDRGSFSSWKLTRKSRLFDGVTDLLITAVNRLLLRGMEKVGDLRFQSAAEMRTEINRLLNLSKRKILRNTQRFNPAYGHFTGMEKYIAQIGNVFDTANYVYVEGIGGIGKTELAKKYAEVNRKEFDIIQLITYDGCLASTIGRELQFHNYDEDTYAAEYLNTLQEDPQNNSVLDEIVKKKLFADKMGFLEEHTERILIIVDNYNVAYDNDFQRFISGDHKVIFTSRVEHKENSVDVTDIGDENDVLALFGTYYGREKIAAGDVSFVLEIGKWALGHTMTIELIAAALSESDDTIESMYDRLKGGITDIGAYAEIDKQEFSAADREQAISAHIRKLFDMSAVRNNSSYEFIMTNMAIVPIEGMSIRTFYEWALSDYYRGNKDEANRDLFTLKKQRWIRVRRDETTGWHILSLHAIVSDIAFGDFKPDSIKCASLINGMIDQTRESKNKTFIEQQNSIVQIAPACDRINDSTELTGELYCCLASLKDSTAGYDEAIKWYLKALVVYIRVLGENHPQTANVYNDLAAVYSRQGCYEKALELHQTALSIREDVFGIHHPATAVSYNNIAGIYSRMGDPDKALEWLEKDLAVCKNVLDAYDPYIAATYHNMANAWYQKRDYDKAMELFSKAIEIREKVLGTEHPDTSATRNNMALVFCGLKDFDKALELYSEDHLILLKIYGAEHPAIATNYINTGLVDYYRGDFNSALEWLEKALPIREKTLGPTHPETMELNNFVALVYNKLGED